jgi:surface polysaccharide O-acyltransferase-like enzyme
MWTVIARPFVNIGVPIFLFLSGYLTKIENKDWIAFFKKRIIRVLIPYLIWTVLYTIQAGDLSRLLFNLLTTGVSPLYYIFVYIQFVLLTPVLGKLAQSKYRHLVWFITPIYLIFYKYIPLFTGTPLGGHTFIICWNLCLGWVTIYYLGLLLGNQLIVKRHSMVLLAIFYAVSILLQMGETYGWQMLGEVNSGSALKLSNIVTSVLFLLIIYIILERGGFKNCNRLMVLIGDYSFGLYLSHVVILRALYGTSLYNAMPYIVNSAVVLFISLAICYVGDKLLGARVSRWFGFR